MLVNMTAHPRSQSVYARAIQLMLESEWKSVPIVNKAVLTIELSRKERKRPRQSLGSSGQNNFLEHIQLTYAVLSTPRRHFGSSFSFGGPCTTGGPGIGDVPAELTSLEPEAKLSCPFSSMFEGEIIVLLTIPRERMSLDAELKAQSNKQRPQN
jgi:hypothetical protein